MVLSWQKIGCEENRPIFFLTQIWLVAGAVQKFVSIMCRSNWLLPSFKDRKMTGSSSCLCFVWAFAGGSLKYWRHAGSFLYEKLLSDTHPCRLELVFVIGTPDLHPFSDGIQVWMPLDPTKGAKFLVVEIYHYLHGCYTSQVVFSPDFWTINSNISS